MQEKNAFWLFFFDPLRTKIFIEESQKLTPKFEQ